MVYMYMMIVVHFRNGGGIGDTSIRKMSYFEGSIDPKYKVCIYEHHAVGISVG